MRGDRFGLRLGQMCIKWDKSGTIKTSFRILKTPRFVSVFANLAEMEAKSDIPALCYVIAYRMSDLVQIRQD